MQDQRDGSCVVFYRVRKPGEYTCSIKFMDKHVPFSPFIIYVSDPKEAGKIEAYEIPVQHAVQSNDSKDTVQVSFGSIFLKWNSDLNNLTTFQQKCESFNSLSSASWFVSSIGPMESSEIMFFNPIA